MVKGIELDEIVIDKDTSKEKTKFLKSCAKRVNEAVGIWTEEHPDFDYKLAQNQNPHGLIIWSSKEYDAEIKSKGWCYIYLVHTRKESKYRIDVHTADREGFLFGYRGQTFKIDYGKTPSKRK